ncbi:uncharacterized protein M421DRAFT_416776 [Didymella exigua CBS 183.55]|uniref:Uncharacterized protein n=1 Tax=Didymella exigua CBS 183.55 TaxID=1150837 RepID=A0A6A5S3H7_9PLEO|nr:uncharacterized protein M421DRAFT_426329 [Didymella exigua CBS 183.55]XP_033452295.1 uncharacterized protein M421DRAFT_416776 [Didymella exigua CBS 183.55]KAF1922956.1 hypothetical protein M421DRAFT_426329 [Didymella exigua CBS 183.55]KAF1932047.1 hypothetical protein M421DRAFT_416776 [Didymella exigua CBS 183.55]
MHFIFALLPFVLSAAVAKDHKRCDCQIQNQDGSWRYDWQLTFNTCQNTFSDIAKYDPGAGRCVAASGKRIDGDTWFRDCAFQAKSGYFPVSGGAIDTTGTPMTGTGGSTCD